MAQNFSMNVSERLAGFKPHPGPIPVFSLLPAIITISGPFIMLAYPLVETFKAVESPSHAKNEQWLTYWVFYSMFSLVELVARPLMLWIPGFYVGKTLLFAWLVLPQFHGASFIYAHFLRHIGRLLSKRAKIAEGAPERPSPQGEEGHIEGQREERAEGDSAGSPVGTEGGRPWQETLFQSMPATCCEAVVTFVRQYGMAAFEKIVEEAQKIMMLKKGGWETIPAAKIQGTEGRDAVPAQGERSRSTNITAPGNTEQKYKGA